MGSKFGLSLMLAAAALALPQPAFADQNWKTNSIYWNVRDRCTRQAQQAFPDYTPESNAKRDRMRKKCLLSNNLPDEGASLPPQGPTPSTSQQ